MGGCVTDVLPFPARDDVRDWRSCSRCSALTTRDGLGEGPSGALLCAPCRVEAWNEHHVDPELGEVGDPLERFYTPLEVARRCVPNVAWYVWVRGDTSFRNAGLLDWRAA